MLKNIIFDFDGVIVDSEILAAKAFSTYFSKLGHSYKEEDFFIYSGMKTFEVINELSKKFKINDKKKFTEQIYQIISKLYFKDLKLVHGAKEFIINSNKNKFIGSNSNKDRIIEGLKIVGLSKIFINKKIYSFDMVKKAKPNPDIYLKIIYDNDLNKDETIIIEDSGIGVRAGNLAGVRVLGLTAGKHWHSNRDKNELYDKGALNVFDNYVSLQKAIGDF